MVQGPWESLFKNRICLPYFMERQCALEIHPGTAPEEPLHRDGSRSCLSGDLVFAGMGRSTLSAEVVMRLLKRDPHSPVIC
jgi:hypothetical protein